MQDRKTALAIGLATMGLVAYTYDQILPEVTDIRAAPEGNSTIASAERAARFTSAGLVIGISVISRDATVFIMGAVAVIALSWLHRHANMVNPTTGRLSLPSSRAMLHDDPAPTYQGEAA